jgi:hypothetical protein
MNFEFAKYTEITDLALSLNSEYKTGGYVRFFICPDVWDFWFVRVLKDVNEDYNHEEGSYILERNKIEKVSKTEKLSLAKLKEIIAEDDFSNWDFQQGYDVEKLIDNLDDGFGILERKERGS